MCLLKGQDDALSNKQGAIIDDILASETFNNYFEELLEFAALNTTANIVSDVPIAKWHSLVEADLSEGKREGLKRSMITEIAGQFRDGDAIAEVSKRLKSKT